MILGAESDPLSNPLTWINFGVLGLVMVALLARKFALYREVEERDKRIEKLEGELASLRQSLDEKLLPLMVRSTDILARLTHAAELTDPPRRRGE